MAGKRIYSIAFTEEEYAALERVARTHGARRADIIRAAVRALDELPGTPEPATDDAGLILAQVSELLRAAGLPVNNER